MRLYFILLSILCTISCNLIDKKGASTDASKVRCEALAPGVLTDINKSTTSVDLISLKKEVNVSMSFDNPNAVQIILSFITDEKAVLDGVCLPEGRLVFQKNGEITHDVDIYYGGVCNAFAFMKDNGIIACNKMSPEGIDFFKNFLKTHKTMPTDTVSVNHKEAE